MTPPATRPDTGRGPGTRRTRGWVEPLVLLGPGLAYLAVFLAVPLVIVLSYAFLERGRFGGVEFAFTLDNFARLARPTFGRVLLDTLAIAGLATLIALLVGYPAAVGIARLPRRRRTVALLAVVLPFWTNFLIRTYAWIVLLNSQGVLNGLLVASGLIDEPLTLLYTDGAVVLGLVYAYLPLMILPIYASVERLDHELVEAAANLGAGPVRRFLSITLPLTAPGIVIGCVFVFVPSVGNFVVPELLGGGKTALVGNLIRDQFLQSRDWPFGAAFAVVMVLGLGALLVLQARVTRRFTVES
jgi:spermidine/putrescine transport system permease protein